ncbi:hypothetical protein Pint_30375 [Pistacia integerrima]|uniref:Uncharacterized protein n=1 Tax=Pistacia integerrima TaxID=434235 RepID=A0ACC0X090_9ROSI|nr:hypothetical protein Pint_30375 [Pistacia integerrima]
MVKHSATETSPSSSSSHSVSPLQTFLVHLICGVGLGVGYWVAHNIYSINLVSHPSGTLRLIWYFKAVVRGLLGLPVGAFVNALGAIALGAPVGIQPNGSVDYMICLPAHGAVIGAWFGAWPMPLDWERPWQHLLNLADFKAGLWNGRFVSYGAMAGYLIGMVASFGFVLIRGRQKHQKGD